MVSGPRLMFTRVFATLILATITTSVLVGRSSSQEPGSATGRWAFRPLGNPDVPRTAGGWARDDLDRFILSRLDESGLRPAPRARADHLVRRLSYDLTGLPPSPETVAKFFARSGRALEAAAFEAEYDALVDRLLASPEFGERWGRHWLDVVRFAESSGGGRSLMFAHAWRFRDYVIESYNADRPFDRFLTEQIAGDLLPYENDAQRNRQLVATGFLELGPTNYELQDKELLRMEVIDEQLDTVGRAFMGLTLGCARCHDHKFDPIPTVDYYALAGIFGSTQALTPGNVSGHVQREFRGARTASWHAYQKRIRAVEAELSRLRPKRGAKRNRVRGIDPAKLTGVIVDDAEAELMGEWKRSTSVSGFVGRGYLHDENTQKGRKSVRFEPRVPKAGVYEVRISYTSGANRATNVPVRVDSADGQKTVRIDQRKPPDIDGRFVSLGRHRFDTGSGHAITVSNDRTDGHVIVDVVQLLSPGEVEEPAVARPPSRVSQLESELAKLKKSAPPAPHKAMAVRDVAKPADGHVHNRGLVRSLGPRVQRGFLRACGGPPAKIPAGESGRRQLAAWLTDPSHPLTARVYVNRVWHHLFGSGLVRTTDNFGAMGERPSHPELLDWIARRFVGDGWSTKALVRRIVRSASYRMAVRPADDHNENGQTDPKIDAENRLLSHANRRRLDAESLRDSVLVISGRLDPARGGNTIRKFSTYDYSYVFDTRRRSVYVPRFRSNRFGFFDIFDAADPSLVTGARAVSTVATQALYLLNSDWLMAQSEHAAKRLLKRDAATEDARLTYAYRIVYGRAPTRRERSLAERYLQSFGEKRQQAFTRLFHALFASIDFRYLH